MMGASSNHRESLEQIIVTLVIHLLKVVIACVKGVGRSRGEPVSVDFIHA